VVRLHSRRPTCVPVVLCNCHKVGTGALAVPRVRAMRGARHPPKTTTPAQGRGGCSACNPCREMNLPLVRWGRPQGDDPPLGRIPDAFGTTTAPLFQAPAPPALQRVQATARTTKKSFWAVHHGPAAAFGYRSSFILGPSPPSLGPSLAHLGPSSRDLGPSSAHLGPSSRDLGPSSARLGPSSRDLGPSSAHLGPSSRDLGPSSAHLGPSSRDLGPRSARLGPSSRDLGPSSAHLGPSSRDLGPSSARSGPSSRDRGPRPMRVRTIYTRYRCTGRQLCWRSTALGLLGFLAGVHSGGRRPWVVWW
jgi:hypothetical protein